MNEETGKVQREVVILIHDKDGTAIGMVRKGRSGGGVTMYALEPMGFDDVHACLSDLTK